MSNAVLRDKLSVHAVYYRRSMVGCACRCVSGDLSAVGEGAWLDATSVVLSSATRLSTIILLSALA